MKNLIPFLFVFIFSSCIFDDNLPEPLTNEECANISAMVVIGAQQANIPGETEEDILNDALFFYAICVNPE